MSEETGKNTFCECERANIDIDIKMRPKIDIIILNRRFDGNGLCVG